MTKLIIDDIKNCTECPFSISEAILTPDPFEHDTGVYCSIKKKRLAFSWEYAHELEDAEVPDWCPIRAPS